MGRLPFVEPRRHETRDTAVLNQHPFGAQASGLLFVLGRELRKHDAAARADDAVPGQMQLFGRHPQRKSCLARATGKSRSSRDRPIGRYLPPRYRADRMPDRLQRGIVLRREPLARG